MGIDILVFWDHQMLQGRWLKLIGGRGRGWSRWSAGSEAFSEGVFARLQESPASVVDRQSPSNDQVRNTYKNSIWSEEESFKSELEEEGSKKDPIVGGVKLLL